MLPPYYFYWFRIDNKHMTEPWLDQGLMDLAYRSVIHTWEYCESCIWIDTYLRIQRELYLDWYILRNTERVVSGLIQTFLRFLYLFMYQGYYRSTKFVIMCKIIFFVILSCTYNYNLIRSKSRNLQIHFFSFFHVLIAV